MLLLFESRCPILCELAALWARRHSSELCWRPSAEFAIREHLLLLLFLLPFASLTNANLRAAESERKLDASSYGLAERCPGRRARAPHIHSLAGTGDRWGPSLAGQAHRRL